MLHATQVSPLLGRSETWISLPYLNIKHRLLHWGSMFHDLMWLGWETPLFISLTSKIRCKVYTEITCTLTGFVLLCLCCFEVYHHILSLPVLFMWKMKMLWRKTFLWLVLTTNSIIIINHFQPIIIWLLFFWWHETSALFMCFPAANRISAEWRFI